MTSSTTPPPSAACACGRLRRAARSLTQLYDDAMAPSGLRVTQYSLLSALARKGTMRISDLALAMLLDRTALSRNLDPLVERKLVVLAPGTDGRTREATLTRAGHAALEVATPYWRQAQARVADELGTAKLAKLFATLRDVEALHPGARLR